MGRCDDTAGKGVCALRKIRKKLLVLAAGLAMVVLTGCTVQPKQIGTRPMSSTANLVAGMAEDQEIDTTDSQLGAGTAAAATYLIKNGSVPSLTNQEDTGTLSEKLREESSTQKYNPKSAPITPGVTRMSRLFIYPGEWPEDEVARAALVQIDEMEAELATKSRQVVIDSYYTYTYTYSVSVQQAYGDQNAAWVVGIGIEQTAKEEHKT